MARDNRLSRLLHVLIHLDRHLERAPSGKIAEMLGTNPVVVRRMMAGLREKSIVRSLSGSGGGWELAKPLDAISLADIYEAIDRPPLLNVGAGSAHPECLVEQSVEARLKETLVEAEALLLRRFAEITVADLATDFDRKFQAVFGDEKTPEDRHGGAG